MQVGRYDYAAQFGADLDDVVAVLVRLGPLPAYVVTDPGLVRRIPVQDAKRFERGVQFDKARPFLGDGLFTEPEPVHLRHRRMMQPAFHHERLDEYVDLMRRAAEHQVGRWQDASRIDVDHEMLTFTVEVLCRSLFRATVPAAAVAREVQRSLPVLLDGLARRVAVPIGVLSRIPTHRETADSNWLGGGCGPCWRT